MQDKKRTLAVAGIILLFALLLFGIIEIIIAVYIVPEWHSSGDLTPPLLMITVSIIMIAILMNYIKKE